MRWEAITFACLLLRDELPIPPQLRIHRDLLCYPPLSISLLVWTPLDPHKHHNSRLTVRPARLHRRPSAGRKPWSPTRRYCRLNLHCTGTSEERLPSQVEGVLVLIYLTNSATKIGESKKLNPVWLGPHLVVKKLSPVLFRIQGKKRNLSIMTG